MEYSFDNTTAFSELSIHNAPQLRCNGGRFTTCGKCEACELGSQLLHTKEWFLRCSDQTQRQFVLGLVHRYNSIDLHEYTNNLLTTLEGKDFLYARSRNRPSLKEDIPGATSNHALNKAQLRRNVFDCLNWFESCPYWSKCNFMLGIMQLCNAQLLQLIGSESRSYFLVNEEQHLSETESKHVEERDVEDEILENDGMSLRVTFSSIYKTTPSSLDMERSRSTKQSFSITRNEDYPGAIFHQIDGTWSQRDDASQGRSRTGSAKQNYLHNWTKDLHDGELSEALDDDYISVDPSSVTDLHLSSSCMLVQHYKDFVRCLPVHLSKLVLSFLDKASLVNCLCISKHWRMLVEEVQQDAFVHQIMIEEVMMMQGATAKGLNPRYAKRLDVCVPKYEDEVRSDDNGETEGLQAVCSTSFLRSQQDELEFRSMSYCYEGIETIPVEMEERNLFCGSYNVFVLQDSEDANRCTTYNGCSLVAVGSSDRRVRLLHVTTGRSEKTIKGHAGSVKCLLISEKRGFVLSGSYDTSIRCWSIRDGKCRCIFRGHRGTVLCLALSGNILASGSRDKSVRVWNFETAKCRRTFRHHHVVLSVDVSDEVVVSGCEGCKIKVWDIESATLVKSLEGHQNPVSGVMFNKHHIVSSSTDCYALAWSAVGKHKKCLQAFRHPKAVLCVKLLYCRVITGAADGKLRIWNLLNGDCLRVIRGNSKNDVITSLYVADNRIVINTLSNLLVLNFESISWNYNLPPDRPESLGRLNNFASAPPRPKSRAYVRAQKLARGTQLDRLIEPTITASRSISGLLDRSISVTPFASRQTSRVSSAPPNVTRQVSQSIQHHVQRLHQARQVKPRPQSSPAHLRTCSSHPKVKQIQSSVLPTEGSFIVKDDARRPTKPDPLPSKQSWHGVTRGRSAPALRTEVLPGKERGWTTSAKDVTSAPHNKLMPTAAEAREHVKRRPQSAYATTVKHSLTLAPKPSPCLNLKTYSEELDAAYKGKRGKWKQKRQMTNNEKTQQPLSCLT